MSAGNPILVTFGSIAQAQGDVQSTAAGLNQQLADLQSYLRPLVGTWEGAASSDYQARQAQWDSAQQGLNEVLQQIGVALGRANETYGTSESRNQATWG